MFISYPHNHQTVKITEAILLSCPHGAFAVWGPDGPNFISFLITDNKAALAVGQSFNLAKIETNNRSILVKTPTNVREHLTKVRRNRPTPSQVALN